jgi:SAM-dependent methyltransferase
MKCRYCNTEINLIMADLGTAPPSNAYISNEQQDQYELWYPLKVVVCHKCWLVQTQDFTRADELFTEDYAYFSSFSRSWLAHAKAYTDLVTERFQLTKDSLVLEVASNDGYLLQYFQKLNIPNIGVEPTHSTASAAREKGLRVEEVFFGEETAKTLVQNYGKVDLSIANNVLAHVPDINDFISGFKVILAPNGVGTFEFPHLQKLIEEFYFDTIYHEHFSYLSLVAVKSIFEAHDLKIFDVEEVNTHGGSYRVYISHKNAQHLISDNVKFYLDKEINFGLKTRAVYENFQTRLTDFKRKFIQGMLELTIDGRIMAYGAAAKGNTLLNFTRIDQSFISCIIDQNPHKQNMLAPGSRIPITEEPINLKGKVLLLPWNLKSELIDYFTDKQSDVELITYHDIIL